MSEKCVSQLHKNASKL